MKRAVFISLPLLFANAFAENHLDLHYYCHYEADILLHYVMHVLLLACLTMLFILPANCRGTHKVPPLERKEAQLRHIFMMIQFQFPAEDGNVLNDNYLAKRNKDQHEIKRCIELNAARLASRVSRHFLPRMKN